MIGIRLKEADSEASRGRDINFYRKKHRCFKSSATLTYSQKDWYWIILWIDFYRKMNKEFLYACQQMLEGGGSGEWQNVPVAKLSIETWFIAANWWQIGWGQGGLWSAPFGRDLIIFTTWSTIWLYQECKSPAPKRGEGDMCTLRRPN